MRHATGFALRLARHALIAASLASVLAGCVSSPKQTVLDLDTTDRRWTSRQCVAARKEVALYNDKAAQRGVVGLVGSFIAPIVTAGAVLAMSAAQDDEREDLNRKVRAACISDPLGDRQRAARPVRRR